jgi:hypothetical protein
MGYPERSYVSCGSSCDPACHSPWFKHDKCHAKGGLQHGCQPSKSVLTGVLHVRTAQTQTSSWKSLLLWVQHMFWTSLTWRLARLASFYRSDTCVSGLHYRLIGVYPVAFPCFGAQLCRWEECHQPQPSDGPWCNHGHLWWHVQAPAPTSYCQSVPILVKMAITWRTMLAGSSDLQGFALLWFLDDSMA